MISCRSEQPYAWSPPAQVASRGMPAYLGWQGPGGQKSPDVGPTAERAENREKGH